MHPLPPLVFEPHTPSEPQWFPKPITDTIESTLDHLERLEEDRRRRLHSIANVAARVPIGLGGTEDRANGAASAPNVSPKPPNSSSATATATAANNRNGMMYGRYRYYPPPEETPMDLAVSLHQSYAEDTTTAVQQQQQSSSSLVTGRSRERNERRNNSSSSRWHQQQRRGHGSSRRNNGQRSTSTSPRDLHTPTDGIGTATATAMNNNNNNGGMDSSNDSGSSIEGGRFIDSFNISTSAVLFLSPPFDPRSGGGGRRRRGRSSIGSIGSSSSNNNHQNNTSMRSPWQLYQHSSIDWSNSSSSMMATPHQGGGTTLLLNPSSTRSSQQHQPPQRQQQLQVETNTTINMEEEVAVQDVDLITPTNTAQPTSSANEHGHGEDVYSQRREATSSVRRSQRQRRRRRDWE